MERKTVEDTIRGKDDKRVRRLIERFGGSKYEWSYFLYQGVIRSLMALGVDYKSLGRVTAVTHTEKRHFGPLGLPIDKYDL